MYQLPSVPQDIGGVLDSGFKLFKAGWRQVLALATVASAVMSAWRLVDNTFARLMEGNFEPQPLMGWTLVLLPLCTLAGLYLNLGVIARLAALAGGRPISVREALRRALRRYPSMLVCLLLIGVLLILPGMALAIAFAAFGGAGLLAGSGLLLFAGALAVGWTLLFMYWYFAFFLLITRNIGGVAAMRASFGLVRGHWWRTTATILVAYCITLVALVLVGVVAAALGALAGLANISPDGLVFAVEAVGGGITMPFMIAVSLVALNDLEVRRQGADLAVRIKAAQP